jgi:multicomponent Na+:H+ antiporter subunit G
MLVLMEIFVLIAILIGTAFSVIGVIGFIRLPDVYTRLHATGKVSIFGVVLLLLAAVFWTPVGIGKDLVLIGLLMLAGPVATHTIASAAYRLGIPMRGTVRNDLEKVEPQPEMRTDV